MICAGCGRELFGNRRLCDGCRSQADHHLLPTTEQADQPIAPRTSLVSNIKLSAPHEQLSRQTAGISIRLLAGAFDGACLMVLFFASGSLFTKLQAIVAEVLKEQLGIQSSLSQASFLVFSVYVLVAWLYFVCSEASSLKASPGKRFFGLTVVDCQLRQINPRRAMVRNFHKFFVPLVVGLTVMLMAYSSIWDSIPYPQITCSLVLALVLAGIYLPVLFNSLRQSLLDTVAGTVIVRKQALGLVAIANRSLLTGIFVATLIAVALFPAQTYFLIFDEEGSIRMPGFAKAEKKEEPQAPLRSKTKRIPAAARQSKSIEVYNRKTKGSSVHVQRWYNGKPIPGDPNIEDNKRHALPVNSNWFQKKTSKSIPKITRGALGYLRWGNKQLNFRGAVAIYHPQEHILNVTLYEDPVTGATLTKHQELSSKERLPRAAPLKLQLKFNTSALQASNATLVSHKVVYHPGLVGLITKPVADDASSPKGRLGRLPQLDQLKISGILDGDGASIALACLSKESQINQGRVVFSLALAVPISFAPDIRILSTN